MPVAVRTRIPWGRISAFRKPPVRPNNRAIRLVRINRSGERVSSSTMSSPGNILVFVGVRALTARTPVPVALAERLVPSNPIAAELDFAFSIRAWAHSVHNRQSTGIADVGSPMRCAARIAGNASSPTRNRLVVKRHRPYPKPLSNNRADARTLFHGHTVQLRRDHVPPATGSTENDTPGKLPSDLGLWIAYSLEPLRGPALSGTNLRPRGGHWFGDPCRLLGWKSVTNISSTVINALQTRVGTCACY
jgi:hypothetical protein